MVGAIIGDIVGSVAEAIWDIPERIWLSTLSILPREMKNVIEKFYDNVIKD